MTAANTYRFELARTPEEFHALGNSWRALYTQSGQVNPFLSFEWIAACLDNQTGWAPFILTAWLDQRLVGVAPLQLQMRFPFRALRFAGGGWSQYVAFLTEPGAGDIAGAMLEELQRQRCNWDVLVLHPLADAHTDLRTRTLPAKLRSAARGGEGAPYLAFDGDWGALCKAGPSWLREMPGAQRRFERDGGEVVRYVGEEAASHVAELAQVEAASWKFATGRLDYQDAGNKELIAQALKTVPDTLEVYIARMKGAPVAFELAFRLPGRVSLCSTCYDERLRKYSPGMIVMFNAVKNAWEAGAREYDFMNGITPYKTERSNAVRHTYQFVLYPTTLRGRMAFALLVSMRWRLQRFAVLRRLRTWIQTAAPLRALARLRAR